MIDTKIIMKDTCELVRACMEKREAKDISLDNAEILRIANAGNMQYLLLCPLLKNISDSDLTEKINGIIKRSTILTYMQLMCAKQITELFEKEKIRHQLLKGAIMKYLYPMPEMRQMCDVDLVVYDESLDRATAVLEKHGYKNNGLTKHHVVFTSPMGITVEVHWSLFDQNVDYGQYLYFKDNFRSRLIENLEYSYEFSREDYYIYMISHMAKHFFETGCGIRNLLDIYVYMQKFSKSLDLEYIRKELKKCGLLEFEENMRNLAYIWMEKKACSDFYMNLFSYMVECGVYGKSQNGVWGQLAKEIHGDKKLTKSRYYFPSLAFMREKYQWLEKMPYLLPLAWIIRGISGVTSKQGEEHLNAIRNSNKGDIDKMLEIYCKMNLDFRKYGKEADSE